jgi:hypothetical protein
LPIDLYAGLSGFRSILDTLKILKETSDAATRNEIQAGLTEKLLAEYETRTALLQEKGALEAEVVRLKDWSAEKERYELKTHGKNGILAYALKETVQPTEPAHSLCPDCFSNNKKTILQPESYYDHGTKQLLVCHACSWRAYTMGDAPIPERRKR